MEPRTEAQGRAEPDLSPGARAPSWGSRTCGLGGGRPPGLGSMGRRASAERAAASLSQSDLRDDVGTGPARRGTGSDRPRLCQSHTPAARGRSPPLGVLGPHPRLVPEGQGPRPAPNCDDHPHDHRDCLCMSPLTLRVVTAQDRQDPGAPAEPFPVGPGLPSALRPRARS